MQKIKVSELFYSLQGEGKYMGVPSVFLRTFGCNFTCSGFGMPQGEVSRERDIIADRIAEFKQYKDLPLVHTGCDSYSSWDSRFKDLSPLLTTDSLAKSICEILPYKEWRQEHLVITGGEPLLGWQRAYPELLTHDLMQNLSDLTFETNGTQELTIDFEEFLQSWSRDSYRSLNPEYPVTFSVSPKLSGSGEAWVSAIRPNVIAQYQTVGFVYLKFVIASRLDADEAMRAVNEYRSEGFNGPVYFMPLGGVNELYEKNTRPVAELAMEYGVRYSARLQCDLFKNAWGT